MKDNQVSRLVVPASLTALLLYQCWRLARGPKVRHPPSPKSLPLVGNMFSIPFGQEYVAFAKLGEQLESDIVYLEVLGQKILVLNSAEAASDLLDKRSTIYSDRPSIPMLTDPSLMNWSRAVSLAKYSELWRSYRRILNNWLNKRTTTQFNVIQERQAHSLLRRLLNTTNNLQPFHNVKNEIYLFPCKLIADNVVHPSLVSWDRLEANRKKWGAQQEKSKSNLYEWLKARVTTGTEQLSLLGPLLQGHELVSGLSPSERDERLKEIGIMLFGDVNFYYELYSCYGLVPHVQARAQQELDTVLGPAVLPKIPDQERLPYIRNLIDEVLRIYPVAPLGKHYLGVTSLGNIWAIGNDPRRYKNPEEFNPDRYLDPSVQRPPIFGWGRRKCPGNYFAEASVFITTASLLSVFVFSKKTDKNGEEVVPQIQTKENSIVMELEPFEFDFRLRSEEHRELILGTNVDKE
ncbi:cytochrome P450 [Rhizoctonia solani]|uniref:Cytochrome P450 n=1 Tax=Rhizoctonia solani TaxID=456999 RepID=A0A8H7I3S3_9AGAM|nr:cytochrome P450 [Rhizoctonia solani]